MDTASDHEGTDADLELAIEAVHVQPTADAGTLRVEIRTNRGDIFALLTPCEGESGAVLTIGGASGGGSDGPADGVYGRLAEPLRERGLSMLRRGYREPGVFEECVLDALAGL